jgi:hypothetical protein
MFYDEELINHLQTKNSLQVESLVLGEWNLNDIDNISNYGNYRYRPFTTEDNSIYHNLLESYDSFDEGDFYTDNLESNKLSEYSVDNDEASLLFTTPEIDRELYFSLKECFKPFRPRSGINKLLWFNNKYTENITSARRPRYYMCSRYDSFKYWNSYRKEVVDKRGLISYAVYNKKIQNQVGTLTLDTHNLSSGDLIEVYGVDNIFLGKKTISSVTSNTISFPLSVSASVSINSTTSGSVRLKTQNQEFGISSFVEQNDTGYPIEDVAPFVVYKDPVSTNRIVIKMQTNLSEQQGQQIRGTSGEVVVDPLGDREVSSIPKRWKVQYLDLNNNWNDAISFNEFSLRKRGEQVVSWNGHVELYYGIVAPSGYSDFFNLIDSIKSTKDLPPIAVNGEAYLVGAGVDKVGELYIWNQILEDWDIQEPIYGFSLLEDYDSKRVGIVNKLVDPSYYIFNGEKIYRDLVYLKGIRIVVETMFGPNATFDLIEMSPRLKVNMTNYILTYEINKKVGNTNSALPITGLSPSNGQISIMNFDGAFNENNQNSLVYKQLKPNVKFEFYEGILNVQGYDKFVPLKTFYSEDFPIAAGGIFEISVPIRDFFFRLETTTAPTILLTNTTLTKAVAVLLDNIGFGNYIFKNLQTKNDPIIPYFFVEPDVSVAEILQKLSVATQTAMFFDEYNNFVIMSKEYLMPEEHEREEDYVITAQKENNILPNLLKLESTEKQVLNNGQINYVTRYIQRSIASLNQATKIEEDRTYIYKPVLLWEVASQEEQKTINEKSKSVGYALGAVPLNIDLTDQPPIVENGEIVNNTIDLGENVYWLPRFEGYLYANGEIIKYDAIEYTVAGQGNFWISGNQEYQKYFSTLPFNGKMFPTGSVRIYSEPFYQNLDGSNIEGLEPNVIFKNGSVKNHGRGQFGTSIVYHSAGLSSYWSDNKNVRGINTKSEYLFTTVPTEKINTPPKSALGPVIGSDNLTAQKTLRNGIIANLMRQTIADDDPLKALKTTSTGSIQSSALVFAGPNPLPNGINSRDFVSYVYKEMQQDFKHFGTRMRILGKPEANEKILTAQNASNYYIVNPQTANEPSTIVGGSGGIGVMVNPEKNYGYFFEIVSLSGDNLQRYTFADAENGETVSVLHNILFYKVIPGTVGGKIEAVPYKLWGGLTQILVDEGRFIGQDRVSNQNNPTVYDLAVEYETIANARRFYLYVNNVLIATVDDTDPLPAYNNIALFTRGSSKCMFENIYALKNLQSQETGSSVVNSISRVFDNEITSSEAIRKYAISGLIQSSYLSGISSTNSPQYSIYFEEFGTIMRECAYFNIKYDKAFPAFLAFLAPTFNNEKTYTTAGFRAGSYGAEFLIFNNTDKAIVLDETSGSYLRIVGVTFTQNTSNILTVDDYFKEISNFSDPIIVDNTIRSPIKEDKVYQGIKSSRSKYGEKSFSLESPYIQSDDLAKDLMGWIIKKSISPKKEIFFESFGTSHLQLGDIVKINYMLPDGDMFVDPDKKFVISEIFYSRSANDVRNKLKVVEI